MKIRRKGAELNACSSKRFSVEKKRRRDVVPRIRGIVRRNESAVTGPVLKNPFVTARRNRYVSVIQVERQKRPRPVVRETL